MSVWTGRERDIAKMIVQDGRKYFIVESNQIGSLVIGGIDGLYSYEVSYPSSQNPYEYPSRRENPYPIILEAKEDEAGYYFTPLETDLKIQIAKEDYLYGDRREDLLILGEIITSTNRTRESFKSSWGAYRLYQNIDSRYVKGLIDATVDSPLVVSLDSLTPKEETMYSYVEKFYKSNKPMIQQDLETRKVQAQRHLLEGYNRIKKELEPIPQKTKNLNQ